MSRIYRFWHGPRQRLDGLCRGAARWHSLALAAILWLALGQSAEAYVGPGAGLGAIGAFLGLLATVLLTVGVLVIWPVRRLLRRVRGKPAAKTPGPDEASAKTDDPAPGGDGLARSLDD